MVRTDSLEPSVAGGRPGGLPGGLYGRAAGQAGWAGQPTGRAAYLPTQPPNGPTDSVLSYYTYSQQFQCVHHSVLVEEQYEVKFVGLENHCVFPAGRTCALQSLLR